MADGRLPAQHGHRPGSGALDRARRHPEQVGHLGPAAVVEVAQRHDRALLQGQRAQGSQQRRAQLDRVQVIAGPRVAAVVAVGESQLAGPPLTDPRLIDDDVVHHPPAEGQRAVHPAPASGEPLQGFPVDVLGEIPVGGQQGGQPQQRVAGAGDELLEEACLFPVHSFP